MANTVKMVAHDVRKPLATAKGAMDLLRNRKSEQDFETTLAEVEKEIHLATKSAESMLTDILEYNDEMKLSREAASVISLFERALTETANWYRKPFEVPIEANWQHTHMLDCDVERILRTLSNILLNACQAMRMKGTLWVKTSEANGQMEIVIGNSNSSIPVDIIQKIFEANFTHGKKKGTGLGLAVAKKTIEAHGGTVDVESDLEKKTVEFHIVIGITPCQTNLHAQSIPTLAPYHLQAGQHPSSPNQRDQIKRIREFADRKKAKITIAVLDDEKVFRKTVESIINNSEIKDIIDLIEFTTPESFLSSDLERLDFLISDVDLDASMNGYDVVRSIREAKGLTKLPYASLLTKPLTPITNKPLMQGYNVLAEAHDRRSPPEVPQRQPI